MAHKLPPSEIVSGPAARRKAAPGSKGFFTTRQLADALGMSESSVKRWANEGRIGVVRTVGGHRRITFDAALKFVRESGLCLVKPAILGLDHYTVPRRGSAATDEVAAELYAALARGDSGAARELILGEFYSGRTIADIADGPVRSALADIGCAWTRNEEEGIFQEHRAMDICFDVFRRLRSLLDPPAEPRAIAIGCAPNRDVYALPTLVASIVLLERGYMAINLGAVTPLRILRRAAEEHRPRLLWIAMNSLDEDNPADPLVTEIKRLGELAKSWNGRIALGGRAVPAPFLTAEWRSVRRLETMRELGDYAESLLPLPE